MYRVLPFLLLIGAIAFAPAALPAQDKDKVEEKKVEEKVEEKKVEDKTEPAKTEPAKTEPAKTETPAKAGGGTTILVRETSMAERLEQVLPIVNLVLLAVVFALLLGLRSTVNTLEDKLRGSGGS